MKIGMMKMLVVVGVLSVVGVVGGCGGMGKSVGGTIGSIERLDAGLDALIDKDAKIEVLGKGYVWSEGPVWVKDGGYLLFSDIPPNRIYKWQEGKGVSLFLMPSGYTGAKKRGGEVGSNGLLLDAKGRLVLCQHGDRRVAMLKGGLKGAKAEYFTLVDHYEGKRLNSPNDAVYKSNGDLYFTDPPYGLEHRMKDPAKELDFQGVYRFAADGKLTLLRKDQSRPNGIAFSPDEKTLYTANSDPKKAVWYRYGVKDDGTIGEGEVMFDATKWVGKRKGLPDGMAVDQQGNIWATGPGGVLVFNKEGKHLGTILTTQATANCAFGDDGSTLYITADMYLLRVRVKVKGLGF